MGLGPTSAGPQDRRLAAKQPTSDEPGGVVEASDERDLAEAWREMDVARWIVETSWTGG
eukprot:CAMPEP_0180369126 /NCGR_PEP_ID=MMETSP0989-20121125/18068_1 /TAXON_ID=697907 /ORGANISM="non described non described, Strain CCMP2293" /LENGTH=58 /DNA_ID=CAMNT_0022363959 /DNA_START=369 /DNA_END=542 /DNA_ORIENTATION=+